jgi:hypothetical protein
MKKHFKYDFANKIQQLQTTDITEIENVDSYLDSFLASIFDNETIVLDSVYKVALPYRRTDWTDERFERTGTVTEVSNFNLTSSEIGLETNINASFYWSSTPNKTLGLLNFIGSDVSVDWVACNNQRIIITAEGGSWFNIKNNSSDTLPDYHKKIKTDDTDLFGITKAIIVYSNSQGYWILESYETLSICSTMTNFTTTNATGNVVEKNITVLRAGLYLVNAYFVTEEKDAYNESVYTETSHLLDIKEGGGIYKNVDVSGNFAIGAGGAPWWYNHSVQGSCLVRVSASDLTIYAQITLPNGYVQRIVAGYMHANFISV